ncbi:unnamed protein product [Ranitomeya imitator]|uniref:Uncharacterized protein n=1 Tax=Ranitomeya imitator TaxID=111125 RepID=A0ABN9LLI0_9NEOB|nr:unnamed protein product [Ranitomeya imitator]
MTPRQSGMLLWSNGGTANGDGNVRQSASLTPDCRSHNLSVMVIDLRLSPCRRRDSDDVAASSVIVLYPKCQCHYPVARVSVSLSCTRVSASLSCTPSVSVIILYPECQCHYPGPRVSVSLSCTPSVSVIILDPECQRHRPVPQVSVSLPCSPSVSVIILYPSVSVIILYPECQCHYPGPRVGSGALCLDIIREQIRFLLTDEDDDGGGSARRGTHPPRAEEAALSADAVLDLDQLLQISPATQEKTIHRVPAAITSTHNLYFLLISALMPSVVINQLIRAQKKMKKSYRLQETKVPVIQQLHLLTLASADRTMLPSSRISGCWIFTNIPWSKSPACLQAHKAERTFKAGVTLASAMRETRTSLSHQYPALPPTPGPERAAACISTQLNAPAPSAGY